MKKTLLASAIAAATFSGSALAMTASDLAEKMDSMPQVYGNIQYVYTYQDSDLSGYMDEHSDNGSTIGFKHEHAITSEITGFAKIEMQGIAADEKGGGSGLTDLDEAYIGIKGDSFGQVWIGSDDSIYETQLGDYGNWVFEKGTLNPYASYTTGEDDMLQYMSPSFGGLTLTGAVQVNGTNETVSGDQEFPYQLGVSYSMSGLTASLVMDSNDSSADGSNENSYGVAFEYAIDALILDAYYDYRAGLDAVSAADAANFDLDGEEGRSQFGLMATYNLGANTFRAAYEMSEVDTGDLEVDVLSLQALHNVSDNLYVYVEGVQRNNENGAAEEEINQLNLGGVYYF